MLKTKVKPRIIAIFGAISTSLGGIGAAIAGFGLCACVLAPIFSFVGAISIIMGFLSKNRIYFLAGGVVLLIISFVLYKRKKTCKIHKK